jgi:HlyD family secretion protein
MTSKLKLKQVNFPLNKIGVALLLSINVVTGIIIFALIHKSSNASQNTLAELPVSEQSIDYVTALGRLEPQGEITHLSAPAANQRLTELRVKEGDTVTVGQIIAVMDHFEEYQAALDTAQAKVNVAQARLAQVQAGEEAGQIEAQRRQVTEMEAQLTGDIEAQQAIIARQEAELRDAETDYRRYRALFEDGAVSATNLESRQLRVRTEEERLEEVRANLDEIMSTGEERIQGARATLTSLITVQPVDVSVAQAELSDALSQLRKAEVDLESVYVRSPVTGQILSVNANAGEIVGSEGIVDIGQTQQMYVVAEVYESDIQYVKVGQTATMVSDYGGLAGSIEGVVEQIGLLIDKPGIATNDPAAEVDVRVVEVKIRLNPSDSERVRTLNNLQVRASIQIH